MRGEHGWEVNDICFACHNATTNGCNWSRAFKHVDGWTATLHQEVYASYTVETYHITDCPEFIPDRKLGDGYDICEDGLNNLIKFLAESAGNEYAKAKQAYESVKDLNDADLLKKAKDRLDAITKYLDGIHIEQVPKKTIPKAELKQMYVDEVLNDPNKDSDDVRLRLAHSNRKAWIIGQLYPCSECQYEKLRMCDGCDFYHKRWKKRRNFKP